MVMMWKTWHQWIWIEHGVSVCLSFSCPKLMFLADLLCIFDGEDLKQNSQTPRWHSNVRTAQWSCWKICFLRIQNIELIVIVGPFRPNHEWLFFFFFLINVIINSTMKLLVQWNLGTQNMEQCFHVNTQQSMVFLQRHGRLSAYVTLSSL